MLKHSKLFDETLGKYQGEPIYIQLEKKTVPPIPRVHLESLQKYLDHLVSIDVRSSVKDTEWALPTFIMLKKDKVVRWISNLKELNKVTKRTQ